MARMTKDEVLQHLIKEDAYSVWFKKKINGQDFPKIFMSLKEVKPWIKCHPNYIMIMGDWQILNIVEQAQKEMNTNAY